MIHCTGNKEGFRLFKKTAWKTFGGKSSTKNTHGKEDQMTLLPEDNIQEDADCFNIHDIARYLQNIFCGQKDVPLKNIWCALQNHPVFPDEGYREEIKAALKTMYSAKLSKTTITFSAQE